MVAAVGRGAQSDLSASRSSCGSCGAAAVAVVLDGDGVGRNGVLAGELHIGVAFPVGICRVSGRRKVTTRAGAPPVTGIAAQVRGLVQGRLRRGSGGHCLSGHMATGDGDGCNITFDAEAFRCFICHLAARGGDGAAGDGHGTVCIDAVAIQVYIAAGGFDGAAGDGDVAANYLVILKVASAIEAGAFRCITCRIAAGGGDGAAGDGHVGVCIDAAAISGRLAARGGDGSTGDGHAVCIDAVASPSVLCRLAARGGDGATLNGHVAIG